MRSLRSGVARSALVIFAGVLPAALLCIGVARHVLNHFFVRAPVLLDAGWYSAIVYHAGLFPDNPRIACDYAPGYYGVHISPFVSAFSILSYLSPFPRIEWYAFFQAMVYLPIAVAPFAIAAQLDRTTAMRRLPITVIGALAFCFSGLVLWTIPYPHYEPAIPGLMCLLLAAVVAGRRRLAWLLLALAVSVRDDGGLHTALALAPLLYLRWRGVELPASRRTLVRMIAVAVAASILAFAAQRLVFHGASVVRQQYLGTPTYGHLGLSLLVDRARELLEYRQLIYYPLLVTAAVAVHRRDPRYLLGWAAALPWFVFNVTAVHDAKSSFDVYSLFPFITAMFWLYLYGGLLAPVERRLRPGVLEAVFAIACASSTLGFYQILPGWLQFTVKEMAFHRSKDRAAVHGFVDALAEHRAAFGRFYVDPSIAALALEAVRADDAWHPGVAPVDAIIFHRGSWARDELMIDIAGNHLDTCTHVLRTGIVVCSRQPLPHDALAGLDTEAFSSDMAFGARPPPEPAAPPR